MTSPSEIPSADLHSSSNGIPSPEMSSTNLEQEHVYPVLIAPQFPYPDVAGRRQVFTYAAWTWDTHIRTSSQIFEASADGLSNLGNTFPPVLPNSVMRAVTYTGEDVDEEEVDVTEEDSDEEEVDVTVDDSDDEEVDVTGENSDDEEVDVTVEDSDDEEVDVTGENSDDEEVDVTVEDSDDEEVDATGENSHDENESSMNDFSHSDKDANTDGSPTNKCSRQGKHKVGKIVLIWTIQQSAKLSTTL